MNVKTFNETVFVTKHAYHHVKDEMDAIDQVFGRYKYLISVPVL